MKFPEVAQIKQEFDDTRIRDIASHVNGEIDGLELAGRVKEGDTVAITAGSRGIANIVTILCTVVKKLKELGTQPFIFPAMGSHGGASDAGQKALLEGLGVSEETMGCPIHSSMEVSYLGDASDGYPVYIDKFAYQADHIVVINRVKAHTKFKGPLESGLMKMMAIGMGKQKGAEYYHKAAVELTFPRILERVGKEVLERCPVLFGLGIVENAYHETAHIKGILPEEIPEGERQLLQISKRIMARLPFDEIDILVIDQLGKDISGSGMDTNVTGRAIDIMGPFPCGITIKRVFVRDLSEATEGNALGVGYTDFVTTRLVEKIDRKKTYLNCITATSPEKGAIPIYFDADVEALNACFNTIGNIPVPDVRLVHIKNTLSLNHIVVSRSFEKEICRNKKLSLLSEWNELQLDLDDNMESPF